MVAPNGARLKKADHPALPVTIEETIRCLRACFDSGADGAHVHLRDAAGGHLLDIGGYRELLEAARDEVPDMRVQITTEAVGIYEPETQMEVALGSGSDLVSVSIREICRAEDPAVLEFFEACEEREIAVQHILYDLADAALLKRTLPPARFRDPSLQLLFVLGRYSSGHASNADELETFLKWKEEEGLNPDWAVCAFGKTETDCLVAAAKEGGKCRVGFENSLYLSNGEIASDNAEKVRDLRSVLEKVSVGKGC